MISNVGGCLELGATKITLSNVLIFNSSAMKGAGIFFQNTNSKPEQNLYASQVNISNNEGTQTSAMEFDSSILLGNAVFYKCVFSDNKVEFYGAFSTFYYTQFNIFFDSMEISHNWGIAAGSAFSFFHFAGSIFINNSRFYQNVLNQSVFIGGAAIFVYGYCTTTFVYITKCEFFENFCDLKGGAIQNAYGLVFVSDCIFIDNYANFGGAISMNIFSPGSLQNVIIQNRNVVNQGGGVHASDFASIKFVIYKQIKYFFS